MSSHPGSYRLGPDNATLTLRTGTAGAMAKAGHNLEIRVTTWSAELELGEDPAGTSLSVEIDSTSLKVIDGVGGPKALTSDDKPKIERTMHDRIFNGAGVSFHSTAAEPADGGVQIRGELTLVGRTGQAEFTLAIDDDGLLSAETTVVQTAYGIEPYSAMMGALKVKDEVVITVDGQLPPH